MKTIACGLVVLACFCGCGVDRDTASCSLSAAYTSTGRNIGIVAATECDDDDAYIGELSISFSGNTEPLGTWRPVCGMRRGLLTGMDFGTADEATLSLVVSQDGETAASCSVTIAVRP